jgi:hypothetical protein
VFAQQYFAYEGELRQIEKAAHLLRARIKRAKIFKSREELLTERIKEIEDQQSKLDLMLPSTLGVESYRRYFINIAEQMNIKVHNVSSTIQPREFYEEATLKMILVSDLKAITSFQKEIEAKPRLINWKTTSSTKEKAHIALTIFSLKKSEKPIIIEVKLCNDFDSDVWLWPFSSFINKRYQELDDLCVLHQKHIEYIRFVQKFQRRDETLHFGIAVANAIKKYIEREKLQK